MARKAKNKFELQCRILQNGRPIKNYVSPFGESQHLFATNNGDDPLGITHYPLSRPISLIDSSKHGTYIEIDHPWEGFIISEGKLIEINGYHDLGKSFKIKQGDVASLAWHDLRFMIKVDMPIEAKAEKASLLKGKDRGSLFANLSKSKSESTAQFMSFFAAAIILAFVVSGLQARKHQKPDRFESLPLEYVAPFVSSDHIRTAPEALQNLLDRKDYVGSIFRYYRSMSNVLLTKAGSISNSIFASLVSTVGDEQAAIREKHKNALQLKEIEEDKILFEPSSALITLPAVQIKSHRETTLALIERIYELHESFEYTLDQKRKFISAFKKESGYNWDEYERKQIKKEPTRAILSGVSRGFRKLPDEDAMYKEAEDLAHKVGLLQNNYLSKIDSSDELTRNNLNTVLLNINGNHLSFTRSLNEITKSEKRGEIPASTFGNSPLKKVIEPLVGNIDERAVSRLLSSKRFDVQLCYESALRRNQGLKGEMSWQWIIDTRGKISDIELVQSELEDNKMTRCIRKKLASWSFPKANKGSVKIYHKFKFRPIKG